MAGAFVRQQAAFRGWPEPGAPPSRYRLYFALACPWSHRTVIVRRLAGLEDDHRGDGGDGPDPRALLHDARLAEPERIIPRGPLDLDFTA